MQCRLSSHLNSFQTKHDDFIIVAGSFSIDTHHSVMRAGQRGPSIGLLMTGPCQQMAASSELCTANRF